jgi:hypothetical protein
MAPKPSPCSARISTNERELVVLSSLPSDHFCYSFPWGGGGGRSPQREVVCFYLAPLAECLSSGKYQSTSNISMYNFGM